MICVLYFAVSYNLTLFCDKLDLLSSNTLSCVRTNCNTSLFWTVSDLPRFWQKTYRSILCVITPWSNYNWRGIVIWYLHCLSCLSKSCPGHCSESIHDKCFICSEQINLTCALQSYFDHLTFNNLEIITFTLNILSRPFPRNHKWQLLHICRAHQPNMEHVYC